MARQTRSANGLIEPTDDENEQLNTMLDNKTNLSSKKRKRNSVPGVEELSPVKQSRTATEEPNAKEESVKQDPSPYPPLAGDLPLNDDDARKILDILDM